VDYVVAVLLPQLLHGLVFGAALVCSRLVLRRLVGRPLISLIMPTTARGALIR